MASLCMDSEGGSKGCSLHKNLILAPLQYLLEQPGKDFRGKLILAFNEWLEIPADRVKVITKIVELLHTSSLLIDDIEDSSQLRRGRPVAHSVYGVAQTINSANYTYFLAHQEAQKLGSQEALCIFNEELLNLHIGQGLELYWRENLVCPTEDEYLEMIRQKTSGLLRLAVRLMLLETDKTEDFIHLADLIGIVFQICDDCRNLRSSRYAVAKGTCEDLTEGKFSLPVIHCLRSRPEDSRILNILRQRTEDEAVKQYAVEFMESTGSFGYCEEMVTKYLGEVRELVRGLEGKEGRNGFERVFDMLGFD